MIRKTIHQHLLRKKNWSIDFGPGGTKQYKQVQTNINGR